MAVDGVDDARRRHYAEFYGLAPLPGPDRPLMVLYGNCQAEAIRVVVEASAPDVATVRIPPVHELTTDDLPSLHRLLDRAHVFASQPVSDGYRGLPIGTSQWAKLAPHMRVVRWPVVRYTGLHPYGALVRTPWHGDPPNVPYHDLRTILAHDRGLGPDRRPVGHRRPEGFVAVARQSLNELIRRERAGDLVPVSDLVHAAGGDAMHTVNHPANEVLVPLAGRIAEAGGLSCTPIDPGRTLLASVFAPVAGEVLGALGLSRSKQRACWQTPSGRQGDEVVAHSQYEWYSTHAVVARAALRRNAAAIDSLGL